MRIESGTQNIGVTYQVREKANNEEVMKKQQEDQNKQVQQITEAQVNGIGQNFDERV